MFVIPQDILRFLNHLPLEKGKIIVGVSGGADSLYLTFLLNEWCQTNKHQLIAVTVDHALRETSHQEACYVHELLAEKNIRHETLVWHGPKPKMNVEEKAREKRYELLIDFCKKEKASALFLAHHQQDQSETFLARLAHASGLDGLCAISDISWRNQMMVVRPLLKTPKSVILKTLQKHQILWVEDPMNQDIAYERVRWRKKQVELAAMGLTGEHIGTVVQRMKRAKEALDCFTQQFLSQFLRRSAFGYLEMDEACLKAQPEEIRIRSVLAMFKLLSLKDKPISLEGVEQIALTCPKHATLSGCQWVISHKKIYLALEEKEIQQNVFIPAGHWVRWGAIQIYTTTSFMAKSKAPSPRVVGIPYLVQRTFLHIPKGFQVIPLINTQKELEKKLKIAYKDKTQTILIKFDEQKEKINEKIKRI